MSDRTPSVPEPLVSKIPRFTAPVIGVFVAVCYAAAMARDFEFDIGHFKPDSLFFHAAAVASVLGVLLSLFYALTTVGRTAFRAVPSPSPLSVFGGILGAAMSVLLPAKALLGYSADRASETAESLSPVKLALIAALLGLFLAAALLLSLRADRRHAWYAVICTLFGGLSVNISMFAAYFDFSVPLNSPVRNFTTLCQAAALLFLLSEARIALASEDEPAGLPPAFQLFASSACAVFGIGIGGGGVLWRLLRAFGAGGETLLHNPDPNLTTARLVLYLALGCIAADRLLASDLRLLTTEEIEENRRKAKEEKEKKKKRSSQEEAQTTSNDQH